MKKELLSILILLVIIILVIGVSVFTLFNQSWTLDETQSIYQALMPINTLIPFLAQDVAAPSYVILLHFWIQFFGTNLIYLRAFSLLFLVASLPVLYIVFKEVSNKKIALITVTLFAFSPFVFWYGAIVRDYSMLIFIVSLNHLFLLRLIRSNGKTSKIAYTLTCIAGFYTHYFFSIFIFSQFLFMLYFWINKAISNKSKDSLKIKLWRFREPFIGYLTSFIIATIAFIPWIVYFISLGSASNTQPLIATPTSFDILLAFSNFIFGFQSNGLESLTVSLWPLVVVGFFFIFTKRSKLPVSNIFYFVFISFFPVFFTFVISYIRPVFLSRYLIFVTPTLFFLIVWTIMSYPRRIASFILGALFILMIALLYYQDRSNNISVKEDYTQIDQYLNSHVQPQDIVAITVPFTLYPVELNYKANAELVTIPEWNQYANGAIPVFAEKGLVKQINSYKGVYENMYVVLSYDQGYESKITTYLDTHLQREKLINYGPGFTLEEFKMRYD